MAQVLLIPGQALDDVSHVPNSLYGQGHLFYSARKHALNSWMKQGQKTVTDTPAFTSTTTLPHFQNPSVKTWKQEVELCSVPTLNVSLQTPWCPFLLPTGMPDLRAGGSLGCLWHPRLCSGTGSEAELKHTVQNQWAPGLQFSEIQRVKHIAAFSGRAVMLLIEISPSEDSFSFNDQPEAKVEDNTKKSERPKQKAWIQMCLLKVTQEL